MNAILELLIAVTLLSTLTHSQAECPEKRTCDDERRRSLDGSCNNLNNADWGTPNRPYARLVPAQYADGIWEPARARSGESLPSARKLSVKLLGETEMLHLRNTLVAMQFGQFIAHDMSFTADADGIQCCADGKMIPQEFASPRCLPIEVAEDDIVMSDEGIECMNMVRTKTTLEDGCSPQEGGSAEQLSSVTAFLDLSVVYGNSLEQSNSLRTFTAGQMGVQQRNGKPWLPSHPNKTQTCAVKDDSSACYLTGDVRSNQSPHLTLIHQAFLLEHNRLASELAALNPDWDDERLFQEARRINVAQYQNIVYYEWLPIYLGRQNMMDAGVLPQVELPGFATDYDATVDPTVSNEFATAAFRFFHFIIAGHLDLIEESKQPTGSIRLSDWFNDPTVLEQENKYELLSRGMIFQPHDRPNCHITPEVKHFLFRHGGSIGVDLKAIDIQRARDHGLASYHDYREYCGLSKVSSWDELRAIIRPPPGSVIADAYETLDDLEFAVGGALERPFGDGMAGPTYACILLDQFRRTRVGDRFYFENERVFSSRQLMELRKASMARLLCDNTHGLKEIQQNPFFLVNDTNPVVPCEQISTVNLNRWR
uniref:Peroxidase n=1 Tax=Anopheles epiroticus TaxID=199890 RepID=A0A9I3FGK9_9DIPT